MLTDRILSLMYEKVKELYYLISKASVASLDARLVQEERLHRGTDQEGHLLVSALCRLD